MIAYLDCSTGVSGDKLLGALLDAGFGEEELRGCIGALGIDDARLLIERTSSHGVQGVRIRVDTAGDEPARTWAEIDDMIARAPLSRDVADGARRAFRLLAEAEVEVHGVPISEVHFHEVGAVDSIVDMVGVSAGISSLGIERLWCSEIAVGSGAVVTGHGTLPVPAPATALLLRGVPCYGSDAEGELTTPTGAALIRAFCGAFGPMPPMTPIAIGRGCGTKDLGRPNICQLVVGADARHPSAGATGARAHARGGAAPSADGLVTPEEVGLIEANVDHISPEQVSYVVDRLLVAGALDAWASPITGKKGRPALAIAALCRSEQADTLAGVLMRESGTLGVRTSAIRRLVAPRRSSTIITPLGEVRVKIGGAPARVRAEYEDCARIARQRDMPLDEVVRLISVALDEAESSGAEGTADS